MKGKKYVGSDELYADVQRTMRLCAEMNSGYHTEAEVRECLRAISSKVFPLLLSRVASPPSATCTSFSLKCILLNCDLR